jgi:hypothetical protein
MHLLVQITFVCQFQHDLLGPNSSDTHDFDGELHVLQKNMQGQSGVCSKPFLFNYYFYLIDKSSQHVGYDVRPPLQGASICYSIC